MKTRITAIAMLAFSLIFSGTVAEVFAAATPAKAGPRPTSGFTVFRGHKQGKGNIVLTWAYAGTAASFTIQRTYETPDEFAVWETIDTPAATGQRSYSFTDSGVYPGLISYRIVANDPSARTTDSPILTFKIVSR